MLRSLTIVPIVAIGLSMPAMAQHLSDRDAWQAGESVVQAFNRASQAKDAVGLAALYSEDVIYVTPDGPIYGRAAVQEQYAADFKSFTLEPSKLDRVAMIGDTVRVRNGSWSGVFQGPDGPVHLKGYWSTTDVREGGTWKIRMETSNTIMPPPPEAGK
jgi:uncharacterized protein (TIGR02246 family)